MSGSSRGGFSPESSSNGCHRRVVPQHRKPPTQINNEWNDDEILFQIAAGVRRGRDEQQDEKGRKKEAVRFERRPTRRHTPRTSSPPNYRRWESAKQISGQSPDRREPLSLRSLLQESIESLVYCVAPASSRADTQIPLINWDTGSRHVNTEGDKQPSVGVPDRQQKALYHGNRQKEEGGRSTPPPQHVRAVKAPLQRAAAVHISCVLDVGAVAISHLLSALLTDGLPALR
ncbi:hypothetical protein EYF80_024710 [Liparis tanakae]|uniref:Uncharacterized protein n=1 Tax=Liparis tanakae TaxID=230148 RepID=A0A4Z2HHL4_9TELE|nr:hypothetical protein EYF80_024710 [Liparis tanakae]